MLQMGRQARSLGLKLLLQPFTNRVTDRSNRPVIDWFAVVGDSAVHHGSASHPFQ
jgi:hypothetical protein